MKMRKLIKAATALSLSVLLLASCSKPSDKPSDDDSTSDKTTVQEKDHGKTSDSSSDKDDDTSSDVDLDGLWCNKYGPYVEIDTDAGTMVFVTGENFLIDKIEDDYIYVHWNDYDRTEYTIEQFMEREPLQKKMRCTYTSAANTNWYDGPISRQGDLRFPISLNGNKLSFLNTVLIPDEEFAKTIPDVKELITSFRFNDLLCETYSYYNLAIPVFKETGTCSFEPLSSGNLTYEIDGMTVTVTDNDNDESVKFYVLYKNEQPILTSEYGGVWYDDFSAWVGDYYEVFTDDIWTISSDRTLIISDGNQETFYDWNSTDASLSFITEEQLSSNYSITYIADFHPHMYGSFRGSITENGSPFPDYYDLAMEGTFEYDLIEYRNEIREGTRSNDIYLTNQYVWKNGNETITVDVDLLGEDISKVWLPDYCSLSLQYHDHEEMFYNYHETCLSSLIHIRKGPYYNAVTITEELTDVDGDIDASLIGCRMDDEKTYGELFDFDSCSIIGDTLTVTCSPISAYDSYSIYISDEQVSSKVDRVFDIKAFLSTDPHDSPWGIDSSGYGCDVIDLVDMVFLNIFQDRISAADDRNSVNETPPLVGVVIYDTADQFVDLFSPFYIMQNRLTGVSRPNQHDPVLGPPHFDLVFHHDIQTIGKPDARHKHKLQHNADAVIGNGHAPEQNSDKDRVEQAGDRRCGGQMDQLRIAGIFPNTLIKSGRPENDQADYCVDRRKSHPGIKIVRLDR